MVVKAFQEFKPWAIDSVGTKVLKKIETQALYTSIYVAFNLIMSLIAAILHFIPAKCDEDIFFAYYLFHRWFPSYGFVLNWLYRSTFFVLGFAMITCGHQFIYGIQQTKFQIYLLMHCVRRITDIEQYNSVKDCELLKNQDFQNEVENRLKFCVKRHIEMLQCVYDFIIDCDFAENLFKWWSLGNAHSSKVDSFIFN
jgi:hypothetical protein